MSEGLKRVYGIDLGTTYSAIAYVDEHGKPVIVPNQESERITPSVVLFDGDNIIVGNTAKESAKVEPHRVVSRIKQHMGDPNFVFRVRGAGVQPRGHLVVHPAQGRRRRRDRPGRQDHRRRDHLPGLFRHARARGDGQRRPPGRPERAGDPERADGRRRSPTASSRARTRRSWSTTWAAARSTSR